MSTKRRILLVDDELTILLTLKAVLEISGFEVETAASAREAKSKLRTNRYQMVITDMRMESESSGMEVVRAAKKAPYQPAVAMLTAFPLPDSDWGEGGADKMLVKPMNTHDLLTQLEALLVSHQDKLHRLAAGSSQAALNGARTDGHHTVEPAKPARKPRAVSKAAAM
jgi:DNA-binding response OmpR family regulator